MRYVVVYEGKGVRAIEVIEADSENAAKEKCIEANKELNITITSVTAEE
jgi:hypothetical protein